MSYVAFDAIYQATMGEGANHRFASAVLLREYGKQKIALTDLGADLGMSLGTCTNQRRRLLDWLLRPKGQSDKKNKNDSLARSALPLGKEPIAFAAAEEALRLGGFIE
ncbi:hypothetical protein [Allopusillimonas ginsengisoli]|uniref:hypothetical protein n=1 Tax=Allopusillimonas ginsengisoli TaxID=453575 RepID=UPI0010226B3A|nr:hypothetical protein [Allopusillimonas ginsengisoli]TEA79824.1 hypothetical protein ERE07_02475 [Allopusillimonas ginsengisoli]